MEIAKKLTSLSTELMLKREFSFMNLRKYTRILLRRVDKTIRSQRCQLSISLICKLSRFSNESYAWRNINKDAFKSTLEQFLIE